MPAVADEGAKIFAVPKGHPSANVRELAGSHGWSLAWDSREDRIIKRFFGAVADSPTLNFPPRAGHGLLRPDSNPVL